MAVFALLTSLSVNAASLSLKAVGSLGGKQLALAHFLHKDEPFLAFTEGVRINLASVEDPVKPKVVSSILIGTTVDNLRISGDSLFATSKLIRYTFDISNPASPAELDASPGTIPPALNRIKVGNNSYFLDATGFTIRDVTDSIISHFSVLPLNVEFYVDEKMGIAYSAPYLFVWGSTIKGALSSSVRLADISDPLKPVRKGFIEFGAEDRISGFAVSGRMAYATSVMTGLRTIQVSDSGTLTVLATYGRAPIHPSGSSSIIKMPNLDAYGDHVYVPDGKGVHIFGIANPAQPEGVAVYEPGSQFGGVRVFGSKAYVGVGNASSQVRALDISNPKQPVMRQEFSGDMLLENGKYLHWAANNAQSVGILDSIDETAIGKARDGALVSAGFALFGNFAYRSTPSKQILDRSDTNFLVVASDLPAVAQNVLSALKIGKYLYTLGDNCNRCATREIFETFDVSDPFKPIALDAETMPYQETVFFMVSAGFAFCGQHGFDLTNPENPRPLGPIPGLDKYVRYSVKGKSLITASPENGLVVNEMVIGPDGPDLLRVSRGSDGGLRFSTSGRRVIFREPVPGPVNLILLGLDGHIALTLAGASGTVGRELILPPGLTGTYLLNIESGGLKGSRLIHLIQ